MDKDEFDKKYHKLNDQLRELEVQNHQQGKSRVEYSIDELKRLIESGKIHNELGGWYIKWIEEQNRQCPKWQKFFKSNKNLPEEDRMKLFYGLPRELSSEETLSRYEEAVKLGQMHNLLLVDVGTDNVNRVERPVGLGQKNQLFKHADPEDNFGICYALANATFYLLDLLEVKPIKSYGDNWTATGRANDSYGRSISLVYDFQASSTAEAEKILEKYKKIMVTKGILVWLAYWMVANKMGRPEYTCPYIDIMKCTIGKNRTSRFESKERQRHSAIY